MTTRPTRLSVPGPVAAGHAGPRSPPGRRRLRSGPEAAPRTSRAKPVRAERPGPPAGPFAGAPPTPGQPRHGLNENHHELDHQGRRGAGRGHRAVLRHGHRHRRGADRPPRHGPGRRGGPGQVGSPGRPAPAKTARPTPAPTKTIIIQQPPAPTAAQPASALRYVGNGIYAGPNTSDAFAQNVVSAWSGTPGVAYVYSPVTGQTYAMTYQIVGAGIVIATGGNGAYVQF